MTLRSCSAQCRADVDVDVVRGVVDASELLAMKPKLSERVIVNPIFIIIDKHLLLGLMTMHDARCRRSSSCCCRCCGAGRSSHNFLLIVMMLELVLLTRIVGDDLLLLLLRAVDDDEGNG